MGLKLLVIVLFIKIVVARIILDVKVKNQEADLTYEGSEARTLSDDEINTLFGREKFYRAFLNYLNRICDLTAGACGQAERVWSIKSATVKGPNMQPVIVMSQDFENLSNHTVKVNAGISHTVQNTLTTSWSKEIEHTVTKEVEYEVSVGFWGLGAKVGGKNGWSFSTRAGVNEEKSNSETIGTTSGVEVELKPGDAVTAVLSANAGSLEIEVVHQTYIKGNKYCPYTMFDMPCHGECYSIQSLMECGVKNNLIATETIQFSFYVEGKISVYEKKSGQLIL